MIDSNSNNLRGCRVKKKMVLLGAGSAMFTQGLVLDLIKNPGKYSWELVLLDVDEDVLESMVKLVKKIIEAKKAEHIEVWGTKDRRDAFPGSDYIVSTIGVGGRRAWEQDVFIPRKYGVFQPVGDTAMPGGISRAMRMIPAMLDIVDDAARLCPNARFFNYSNPMAMICRAIYKAKNFPVTGLCIGVPASEWEIADLCGFERNKFNSVSIGVNHLTFLYKLYHNGEDAKQAINKKLEKLYKGEFDAATLDKFYAEKQSIFNLGDPFAWTFYKTYGAFPAPGDRHITEFITESFPGGTYYGKTLGIDAYSFEGTIKLGDTIHREMMDAANSQEPLPSEYFEHIHGEHELLMAIIDAIETDSRRMFSVNLPNRGAVPNLPYHSVLEMPAVATADGFRPIQVLDFPDVLAGFINRALCVFELAVEAALTGSRRLFEEAVLAGGYISDRAAVSKMTEELLTAQKAYLPQF
jgi:alpha-galactosidase